MDETVAVTLDVLEDEGVTVGVADGVGVALGLAIQSKLPESDPT